MNGVRSMEGALGAREAEAGTGNKEQPSLRLRRWPGPALTLIFLAPLIAEVLSGATRLSYLFVLVPEMMVWGCGALLAREAVRRWRAGWPGLLLLGLGLSIAEEFVIQQTSLAPLPWPGRRSATAGCGA